MPHRANLLLRDYQQDIVFRVHEAWKRHRSVMVQMPTGTGKTHVLGEIVTSYELQATSGKGLVSNGSLVARSSSLVAKNILIVAHRVELIEQIKNLLHHSSLSTLRSSLIKVESIQTISRRIDSLDFAPDLIVIDEAHHALAKTYKRLWEKWPDARFLGLTATPCRMNHCGFTDLFDTLVSSWSIAEFIRKGVLSAFDYVSIRSDSMEQRLIDSLEKRGADGDYQIKEMDEVLNRRPSIERLYRSIREFAPGKKGIVYAISIDHARRIAEYYNRQGIRSEAIDSRTPKELRKLTVEEFKEGKIQVLVNVDVFSEGFDCPDVEFVQMARPTLSLSKYLQQVGRGLRRNEGKEFCTLIDNVGLCRVFGLPILAWNWERMFCGEVAGKGKRSENKAPSYSLKGGESKDSISPSISPKEGRAKTKHFQFPLLRGGLGRGFTNSLLSQPLKETDLEMGLVISHDTLLEKLGELEAAPMPEEREPELKAWQDEETGLWGLKRGRRKVTEAEYVTVFGIKEGMAAVRFLNYVCGVVDDKGNVCWKGDKYQSMQFARNNFLMAAWPNGKELYVDLYNFEQYKQKPDVRRFGGFELLEVENGYRSRTERVYVSQGDVQNTSVTNKGYYLYISEYEGENYCLLKGDCADYYLISRRLSDGSIVVRDGKGNFYHAGKEGEKQLVGNDRSEEEWEVCQKEIVRLTEQALMQQTARNEEKRQKIFEKQHCTEPFKSGTKWGLKVDGRITVPPIYRQIAAPIGKYCAVEKNYSQWGVIAIDGTVIIEPKYPEVSIAKDGTAMLTQLTGRKMQVKLQ